MLTEFLPIHDLCSFNVNIPGICDHSLEFKKSFGKIKIKIIDNN